MIVNYIEWLCGRVSLDLSRYGKLAHTLFSTSFEWPCKIPLDANRASDGIELRYEYQEEACRDVGGVLEDCSVLEMMVALSERIDGIIGEPGEINYSKWFMEMLRNLDLDNETDRFFNSVEVDYILRDFMLRRIDFDGSGGLFPLRFPTEDQRSLSIWDQMSCYINENY